MDVREKGTPIQVRLQRHAPVSSSRHKQIEMSIFSGGCQKPFETVLSHIEVFCLGLDNENMRVALCH